MTEKDPDYITPAIKAKLRLKNKLLRQGKMEKANALSVCIGHAIAKKSSIELSHLGGRATSKDLWNAVKRVKSRSRCENMRTVEGLNAEMMNQHYQMISTDSEPCYKQTVRTENAETFTEFSSISTSSSTEKNCYWFRQTAILVLMTGRTCTFCPTDVLVQSCIV